MSEVSRMAHVGRRLPSLQASAQAERPSDHAGVRGTGVAGGASIQDEGTEVEGGDASKAMGFLPMVVGLFWLAILKSDSDFLSQVY
jgi:hypothetical protein